MSNPGQEDVLERRARLFKALGHPVRLLIVALVRQKPRHGEELAAILGLNAATVSHHLALLAEAGLLRAEKDQYYQTYALVSAALQPRLADLIDLPPASLDSAVTGDAYRQKVLQAFFKHGRLLRLPAQVKKQRIVLEKIVQVFEPGRAYNEREVNLELLEFHDDAAALRRALVEQRLMERSEGVYRRICVGQGALLTQGIAQIEASYQQFLALFTGMSVEKRIEPGAVGKWSLKDLLAHIAVHEERMLEWLRARLRGEQPTEPQPYALPEPLIDEINEQIYLENAGKSLAEVLERFSRAHQQVHDWLAGASEADLFDPARYRLEDGEPLWAAVAANTCDHYAEHGADLQAWLQGGCDLA